MKYDFTTIIDRKGYDSLAVDKPSQDETVGGFVPGVKLKEGFSIIPMWVADMNFATVPTIAKKIIERANHPLFGYFMVSDDYYNAIINWHKDRYGVDGLKAEHIGYENGVLGGVCSALDFLCPPGEKVILQSPTYIGFTHSCEDKGCHMVLNQMYQDEKGIWRIDYDLLEKQVMDNKIHVAIFNSPHNPTGRVWEKEEIEKVMDIYKRHDVYVISDEIWADIIMPGYKHIPTQSVSEDAKMRTIALYAPSKTFNLAGLVGSYHVIYNPTLRDKVERAQKRNHYNHVNVLSMHALVGAYCEEGKEWVDELCEVINGNLDYAVNYIDSHFEGVTTTKPDGTYMLFVDCEQYCKKHNVTVTDILREGYSVGVVWQDGRPFHGEYCIRMNLALPLTLVKEAFDRLDKYVFNKEA